MHWIPVFIRCFKKKKIVYEVWNERIRRVIYGSIACGTKPLLPNLFQRIFSLALSAAEISNPFNICRVQSWRAFYSLSSYCMLTFQTQCARLLTHSTCGIEFVWQKRIQNTDTQTSIRFTCKRESRTIVRMQPKHTREPATPESIGRVRERRNQPNGVYVRESEWSKAEIGWIWVAAVCFVPIFFSTSADFELSGTRNHAVRLNEIKPYFT